MQSCLHKALRHIAKQNCCPVRCTKSADPHHSISGYNNRFDHQAPGRCRWKIGRKKERILYYRIFYNIIFYNIGRLCTCLYINAPNSAAINRCQYMSMHLRCIDTAGRDVGQIRTFVSTARSCLCTRRPCLLSSDQHAFRQVRCSQLQRAITSSACVQNIFELGKSHHSDLPRSLSSLFSLASGSATCGVTSQLIRKFGESLSFQLESTHTSCRYHFHQHFALYRTVSRAFTSTDRCQCDKQNNSAASLVQ